MRDFDAMEDLETFKTNFPQQTNPLYEAVKKVLAWFVIALVGFFICLAVHGLAQFLADWLSL